MSPSFSKWNSTVSKGLEYDPVLNTGTGSFVLVMIGLGLLLIIIALAWLFKLYIQKKIAKKIKEDENNRKEHEPNSP